MTTSSAVQINQPDLDALKSRQHGAWSSGDYAIVGTTLQIVGEELCEASIFARTTMCSTLRPATATLRSPRRGVGATWSPPITYRHCWIAPANGPRRIA